MCYVVLCCHDLPSRANWAVCRVAGDLAELDGSDAPTDEVVAHFRRRTEARTAAAALNRIARERAAQNQPMGHPGSIRITTEFLARQSLTGVRST